MEVHAHTHTAADPDSHRGRKKCPPDRTGRDPLFPGVFNVIPGRVLRVIYEFLIKLLKNRLYPKYKY